jgi:hypothetical protein
MIERFRRALRRLALMQRTPSQDLVDATLQAHEDTGEPVDVLLDLGDLADDGDWRVGMRRGKARLRKEHLDSGADPLDMPQHLWTQEEWDLAHEREQQRIQDGLPPVT